MLQTSSRLLALLSLLQERREWSGPELAGRLDVGPRTIRRDVDKLRELGYPIEAAPGVAGGYRLGAGAKMPPLLLNDAETIAVAIGLRSAATGSLAGIEEASVQALAKLEQLLPDALRRRVRALASATSALPIEGPQIDPELLVTIAAACRDTTRLAFDYVAKETATSRRDVDPAAVVHSGRRWYLVAFDRDRDAWRTFRIDRIQGGVRPGGRGTRHAVPGGDPSDFVKLQLRYIDQSAGPAGVVRVHAPASEVTRRVPSMYGTVESDGPDHCVVTTVGSWHREFIVYLAMMDLDLDVLGPPELAEAAAQIARRLGPAAAPGNA